MDESKDWMERCMIEWWKEKLIDGRIDRWIAAWVDKQKEESLDENGSMDKSMGRRQMGERLNVLVSEGWINKCMDKWVRGHDGGRVNGWLDEYKYEYKCKSTLCFLLSPLFIFCVGGPYFK